MINNKKSLLSGAAFLLLVSFTFYLIFRKVDVKDIVHAFRAADIKYICVALVMAVCFITFEALAIKTICCSLGEKTTLKAAISYSSIDIYFSCITPSATGGQPAMIYYMKRDGIHIAKSSVVVLFNTLLYTLSLVVLGLVALPFVLPDMLHTMPHKVFLMYLVGMISCIAIIIFCAFAIISDKLLGKICRPFISLFAKIHLIKDKQKAFDKLDNSLFEYQECSSYIATHKKAAFKAFFYNMMQRICIFSVTYFVYRAFGLNSYGYFYLTSLQIVLTVSTYVIPVPGSIGVSEWMFKTIFGRIYTRGFIFQATFISRVLNFYINVIVCCVITVIKHYKKRRKE